MNEIVLTTTTRISKKTTSELESLMKKHFGCTSIRTVTDDRIIGGFTVRYDGMFYDMSIASQLSKIKSSLDSSEADK